MNSRENYLRAVRFETPERIPIGFHINGACWQHYDHNRLQDLMESHPLLFPGYRRKTEVRPVYGLTQRAGQPYTDPWGCTWETSENGITGVVRKHPLADWKAFGSYRAPDPGKTDGTFPFDWTKTAESVRLRKERGELVKWGLPHGHTFLRLADIRGYENLLLDMLEEEPRLARLIEMVERFNQELVTRLLALDLDVIGFPEDLGMQKGPMLSPDCFRKFIKPVYQRLMKPARERGCIVHMHSDGDIRTLVDDLIEGGVQIINLQDLVNGIDWIAERFGGRTCVDLDIDRQLITARGTPAQINRLVREAVEKIGSKRGGLLMTYGLYPGVPLENIKALMDALERYAVHYS